MKSIWQTGEIPEFPTLAGDISTDVLIIGGGAAGLLCAYYLRQCGVDCVLVEKEKICSGVTQNTTAKITAQHGFVYQKIERAYGLHAARKYYEINQKAIGEYERLSRQIPCDFTVRDNVVYTTDDGEKAQREKTVLRMIGCDAEWEDTLPIPVEIRGAVRVPGQAQFHPLKFFAGLSEGLPIYEHTWVREMIGCTAVTDSGKIRAKKVIVATHFPFINKHGGYFLKLYQHRSYVLALKGTPDFGGMYVDENDGGFSFRNAGDYLLLGGGGARTGKKCGGWEELKTVAKSCFPGAETAFAFAAQDCMSLDVIPYIGPYARGTEGLYVATGFNKWGMTSSMVAAMLLCDAVRGKRNPYQSVFDPTRSILHPSLAVNGWEAVTGLLSFRRKRCPHLGCALHWNAAEHTWDCSCHGSRFAADGKVLDNPANGDLPE
ncbi:MAG: FAD-dependent oxidoreductase [Ruminococcus sp.]|nr:FAD-dependent oxidoreductase [Candidatus Apopatosoma intestinale]